MTDEQSRNLNEFFVHVYNQILAWEGQIIKKANVTDLSVRELHIIEAIDHLAGYKKNKMANIAKFISVTPGALTTSVNALVNKGYLKRDYTSKDRRVIYITLTEAGRRVNEIHCESHKKMVEAVGQILDNESLSVLTAALNRLSDFFKENSNDNR